MYTRHTQCVGERWLQVPQSPCIVLKVKLGLRVVPKMVRLEKVIPNSGTTQNQDGVIQTK